MKPRFFAVLILSVALLSVLVLAVSARDLAKAASSSTADLQAAYAPGEVIVEVREGVDFSSHASKTIQSNRVSLDTSLATVGARSADRMFSAIKLPLSPIGLNRVYRLKIDPKYASKNNLSILM